MAYHLGPAVTAALDGSQAQLRWATPQGSAREAGLDLPDVLTWSVHRGESDPPSGWYSPAFGERVPSTTLIGTGVVRGHADMVTRLTFDLADREPCDD
jgi:hypothetical protein